MNQVLIAERSRPACRRNQADEGIASEHLLAESRLYTGCAEGIRVRCRRGERQWLWTEADGRLAMFVYDPLGQLVISDRDELGMTFCAWTASCSGTYYVQVVNEDRRALEYTLRAD